LNKYSIRKKNEVSPCLYLINYLSVNVVHSRQDARVAYSGCSASYRQNH